MDDIGYYKIITRKEGNHSKFLHRLIWEDFWGTEIPKCYHIHHKNGNLLDNCILNLQLIRAGEHNSLHKAGEKHHEWKNYARIIKSGKHRGKQSYCIKFNGKKIKYSNDRNKLIKWFEKEYPNEKLKIGV